MMPGSGGPPGRGRLTPSGPSSAPALRSSSPAPTGCSCTCSSASGPLTASSGWNPVSRAHSLMLKRSERSSSTMSSVWAVSARVGLSPLAMASLHGEIEQDGRASILAARDLDAAAVLVHDGLRDGKAEPGALRLGRKERIEQLVQHAARNAGAGVTHPHLDVGEPACPRAAPLSGLVRGSAAPPPRPMPAPQAPHLVTQHAAAPHRLQR